MIKYVAAYLGAGLTFAAIDFVWLTTMTNRLYLSLIHISEPTRPY